MIKYKCPLCGCIELKVECTIPFLMIQGQDCSPFLEPLPNTFPSFNSESIMECENPECAHTNAVEAFRVEN